MEYNEYTAISDYIKTKTAVRPQTAVVLGSGLGGFADEIDTECIINYSDIKGFPVSTAEGHKGAFVFGYVDDIPVVLMQGRVHLYEGYGVEKVVLPIRILSLLGVKNIILTNAAGGINKNFNTGDFMIITDHISAFIPNPLIGKNIDEFGVRFPDMSDVYNPTVIRTIQKAAIRANISVKEGVYVQLTGPSYESKADINMLNILGADAVGMSTVCEAIAAKHCGMRVGGISLITNPACGISATPLSHKEVQEAGKAAEENFKILIKETIKNINED